MEFRRETAADDDTRWLIAREIPRLRRYARVLRNDSGADDLVQDCLERALRKRALWQRGTNMRAWLFRILYNLHLTSLRSKRRSPQTVPLEDISAAASQAGSQIDSLELKEMALAFRQLPADQREVIALVAVEGMRYDEAAEVLGVALGTVRSRLSRGRAALREALAGREILASLDEAGTPRRPRLRRVK